MSDATSRTQLRSDFDNFLWSPIGNDAKGMPVSVLSALARAKPDPWKEAAELARLPRDSAVQRLAQCIGTTQGVVPGEADSKTIATKLIAQLPRQQIFENCGLGQNPVTALCRTPATDAGQYRARAS